MSQVKLSFLHLLYQVRVSHLQKLESSLVFLIVGAYFSSWAKQKKSELRK